MTKTEFYQSVISFTKKTGQGVPAILFETRFPKTIKGLLEDGRLQKIRLSFGDSFLCLTKGYTSEADEDNMGLSFIRHYLGKGNESMIENYIKNDPETKAKYQIWLAKNKSKIDELMSM